MSAPDARPSCDIPYSLLISPSGTPNSTTTSMSELSTVAIKDGHRGHPHHHSTVRFPAQVAENNVDAERADRISRLAGLERLSAVRPSSSASLPPGASATHPQGQGFFDAPIAPPTLKERSTVGSASATGSVGGRTTWASGSDAYDATDKMSEDQDMDTSSDGGFSEGNASLVGFGEGASSTVSGPVSGSAMATPGARLPPRGAGVGSPFNPTKVSTALPLMREPVSSHMSGVVPSGSGERRQDSRAYDGTMNDFDGTQ